MGFNDFATVYLRNSISGKIIPAVFDQCIFKQLKVSGREPKVSCKLIENKLILHHPKNDSCEASYILYHPPTCPMLNLTSDETALMKSLHPDQKLRGAVSVMLEANDDCVLLTRRAIHMRTFPGIWVPPGGHIDAGEDLQTAGFRELAEETNITVTHSDYVSCNILGLFESVFPNLNHIGIPSRHHIVVYLIIKMKKSSKEIDQLIKLDEKETDAYVWINRKHAKIIANYSDFNEEEEPKLHSTSSTEEFFSDRRISEGTRFAISLWYRQQITSSL